MPECHKCPHEAAVRAGRYKDLPYAQTPCGACLGLSDEPNNHGRSHVSMDSSVAGEHEAIREQAAHVPEPEPGQVADAWAALGVFVRTFMALAPQTREIVAFRVLHPEQSLRVCAKRLGVTVQSAHQRLKLAVEKWPALASVIRIHERGSDGSGRETVEG